MEQQQIQNNKQIIGEILQEQQQEKREEEEEMGSISAKKTLEPPKKERAPQRSNNSQDNPDVFIVVVLGLKLRDDGQMEIDLIDRLELANRVFQCQMSENNISKEQNAQSAILLTGKGNVGVEAITMGEYLQKSYAYPASQLILETRSMTTVQNYLLSFFEIWKRFEGTTSACKNKKIVLELVTSDFHKDRSEWIYSLIQKKINQAFQNNQITVRKFYGALTKTKLEAKSEERLRGLSKKEVEYYFFNSSIDWKYFEGCETMDTEEKSLFLKYVKLVNQGD